MKCRGFFDLSSKKEEIDSLNREIEEKAFWEEPEKAKKILQKKNQLLGWIEPFEEITKRMADVREILPEIEAEQEIELIQEIVKELDQLEQKLQGLELKKMLSSEVDEKGCFFSINAGAGGTESCDWVAMLSRMYLRWAEKKRWKVQVIDRIEGDTAGIKSITYQIEGDFAYGYCKSEKGVHRLVRISPFDSGARRHTSFASVDVSPIVEDIQIEINPEELKIDTYRASGAGGQHVNKTDSAVRLTHLPTKIVVSCQKERSQLQNKEIAFRLLKGKLYEKKIEERDKEFQKLSGEKKQIAWGSQIRSYVFHPYTLVKDERTEQKTGNIEAVMDGDIDLFVTAYLKRFG